MLPHGFERLLFWGVFLLFGLWYISIVGTVNEHYGISKSVYVGWLIALSATVIFYREYRRG